MEKVLIFGHKSPDTDAITSAISFAYLQNSIGVDAEAVALGETPEETSYALDYFGVDKPRVVTTVSEEADKVMLVDHNEAQQSADDIDKVTVLSVVDHHRIANFQTADPLYYRAEPVGCTNTILLKLYKEHGVDVPKKIAGLMLSAIISDTLLFKSPTCTEEDISAAKELAEIADVSLEEYGIEMLKAGTNTKDKSADDLLNGDAKNFPMGESTVRVGQVNVVDTNEVLGRKEELLDAMKAQIDANHYDLFVLLITDILESDSTAIVFGAETVKAEAAFDKRLDDNVLLLDGVVSRKKQVVPQLTKAFED